MLEQFDNFKLKSNFMKLKTNTSKIYIISKRILDILISIILLVTMSPIFLITSIAIKMEDIRGPVFYTQYRVGKNGKHFKIFKFRSMYINAEEMKKKLKKYNEIDGAMFKIHDDPRVTKVGKFIRKHSIDELPQLINVLIGNMSLVGPRPPLIPEVKKYEEHDKLRLLAKPGCTGLWQISGRNALSFKDMVKLDLYYIEHANIKFDLYICLKTFVVMLLPNNAC